MYFQGETVSGLHIVILALSRVLACKLFFIFHPFKNHKTKNKNVLANGGGVKSCTGSI